MKRHLYEIVLSENELREIINSLCGVEVNETIAQQRQILAKRLESQLWLPFHQNVAIGRNTMRVRAAISKATGGRE